MNIKKNYFILVASLLLIPFHVEGDSMLNKFIDNFEETIDNIRKNFDNSMKALEKRFNDLNDSKEQLTFKEDKKEVIFTVPLKKDIKNFKAGVENDTLKIVIEKPKQNIKIITDKNIISFESEKYQGQEDQKSKGKLVSSGYAKYIRTIDTPVELSESDITYEKNKLIITIPKIISLPKKNKKIEVKIK